jgi:hypothetical protein
MPYISKAEREAERAAESRMVWSELITHIRDVERCDEREARRQIGNAIEDGMLSKAWADERFVFQSGPMQMPRDEPPCDAGYWLECKADPADPDRVLERVYDPRVVDKPKAAQLDRKARFRKPIFSRKQALTLWPLMPESAQSSAGNILHVSRRSRGRPTAKHLVKETLSEMRAEGLSLTKPHKTLAAEIAVRKGYKLDEHKGWDERTIVQHISDWLREHPDHLKR